MDVTFHEEVPYYVSPSSPIQGERGSELECVGLENDVFEDIALGMETTRRTEASDRSPISEDETCGPCEETTYRPLELDHTEASDQLPVSGDEAGALDVETTGKTKASDQSPIYESNDSDSCMDEFDPIPPSTLLVSQSTRDSESSELRQFRREKPAKNVVDTSDFSGHLQSRHHLDQVLRLSVLSKLDPLRVMQLRNFFWSAFSTTLCTSLTLGYLDWILENIGYLDMLEPGTLDGVFRKRGGLHA
ncbi:hypothetical protein L3X38_024097 [Prunus dulcis]|uniref:Uncharacterized protein n=1 Tax=Prunus dulcis TaxID=3755 RepID=A0AAD4VZ46_PRUDU|nr:hypothetical protein L3X38_024097 [Prunus dulcis]